MLAIHPHRPLRVGAAALLLALLTAGCGSDAGSTTPTPAIGPDLDATLPAAPGQTDTLMLAQAYFKNVPDAESGKTKPVPAPAKLTLIRGTGEQWEVTSLEDEESNVFHKALALPSGDGSDGILTIAANGARLKAWTRAGDGWEAVTHWAPTFGGQQERLRDMERGDVTGDGRDDLVIATHDLGVVAVVEIPESGDWKVHEVDRTEDRTFVHEIELGDVDGDGVAEFFATPSAPNVLDGTPQPGRIVGYRFKGGKTERFEIASFLGAHVKEILVADLEGRGRADLYASIEPERKKVGDKVQATDPLIIRRYRWGDDGQITETDIANFRDEQCRFLVPGDLTGDGKLELVASTMTAGVYMLRQGEAGWTSELVAKDSRFAEFEHAAAIIDLDGDGKFELYVMSDGLPSDEGKLRRFLWNGDGFDTQEVAVLPTDHMTFNITAGKL